MRIDRLRIPAYRNLRSFEVDLDESVPTTVLLGRNGSGKSNLLEAIVEIFRDLELEEPPSFAYLLEYQCRNHTIRIDADPARAKAKLEISVDGQSVTQVAFRRDSTTYLPNFVFAYYSGWSSRLERHFDRPTRKHYERVLRSHDDKMPLRRMFFCRKEYSQLVLLAFFLTGPGPAQEFLERYLRIRHFESALFVLKTPWWKGSGAPNKAQAADGDPRFWYARGAFRGFLDRLWRRALAPLRNTEAIERDVRRQGETTERLYLYVKNEQELAGLMEDGETPKDLFAYLESLFLCDLIDEVRVTVERVDGTKIKFTQMSEGEQQLLTVLGLLLFTQNDESLYLLDEPDTHLNPVWTYDFLALLEANIRADKGQLLIATHNPLMIGSLRRNQVRIIGTLDDGQTTATEPAQDPIGIGVEGLLKSELYGLRSSLAPEILDQLDRHYSLLGKSDLTSDEREELRSLAVTLNELGIAHTYPNPYFEQFAIAMARRLPPPTERLSAIDIQEQTTIADEILAELLNEEREVSVEASTT